MGVLSLLAYLLFCHPGRGCRVRPRWTVAPSGGRLGCRNVNFRVWCLSFFLINKCERTVHELICSKQMTPSEAKIHEETMNCSQTFMNVQKQTLFKISAPIFENSKISIQWHHLPYSLLWLHIIGVAIRSLQLVATPRIWSHHIFCHN